jgi:polyferredoxin
MSPRPDISLPQLNAETPPAETRKPRRYARWRVATLIGVHVLFAIHLAHWRLAGKTIAPLELNEVMHTLELGIVTAGFVLMALIVLSVTVFGRFFCSWGCHILALQDLSAYILGKLRIRAKPVRSRVLLLVAPGAMLYMFVWPQVSRLIEGRPTPTLRLLDDTGGWASFVTDDFWRNLPGPGMALLTLAVCGFAIVYFLGTRSFCLYACPYGAVFGIMDRFAPGRIKVDPDKCTQCGVCTAVCESHVRVHEEIDRHGRVVDAACLKDLDCITACPEQALSYGWTRPSLLASLRPGRRRLPYDFTVVEDVMMAGVFLVGLATFRGLYGRVPFLLALAVSGILAYLAILAFRLFHRPNVRFNSFQLKLRGSVTPRGRVFAGVSLLVMGFVLHSAFIRYHEVRGRLALNQAEAIFARGGDPAGLEGAARRAVGHLDLCERWGLLTAPGHYARKAAAWWGAGNAPGAEQSWTLAIEQDPEDQDSRLNLAGLHLQQGQYDLAVPLLHQLTAARERSEKDAVRYATYRGSAWHMLGTLASSRGDRVSAREAFDAASVEEQRIRSLTGPSH